MLFSTTLSQVDLFHTRFSGKGVVSKENFSSQYNAAAHGLSDRRARWNRRSRTSSRSAMCREAACVSLQARARRLDERVLPLHIRSLSAVTRKTRAGEACLEERAKNLCTALQSGSGMTEGNCLLYRSQLTDALSMRRICLVWDAHSNAIDVNDSGYVCPGRSLKPNVSGVAADTLRHTPALKPGYNQASVRKRVLDKRSNCLGQFPKESNHYTEKSQVPDVGGIRWWVSSRHRAIETLSL